MKDRKLKVIAGALLHDVGKVIYREGTDKRNHSVSGYDYLKEEAGITDQEILDCVKNHHISLLKNAGLEENSLAYIVYIADNIAAFADRRKKDFTDDSGEQGFEIATPLQSVFNILNGNHQEYYYSPGDMSPESKINYPTPVKQKFSEHYYSVIKERLSDNLKGLTLTDEYINSLLSVMEANLSYMPSSTAKAELSDISLFDHVKLTAAIASCIYDYLEEKGQNYKQQLLAQESSFYDENAFMLCSLDISGIQSFIYTIASKNALRTLRTRSFYLEIMMEHMIDMVLGSLELSRANLIYSGGGHCYLLVPNTKDCLAKLEEVCEKLQWWFLENFQTDLYVTFGTAACSGNIMRNVPEGSYAELFHSVTGKLSEQKQQRYSAKQILWLNRRREKDYSRECKVCRKIGAVDDEEVCSLCRRIEAFSKNVLYSDFFTVVVEDCEGALPLPGGAYLIEDSEKSLKKRMDEDANFVRAYAKNKMYTGKHIATKLWVGDYTTGDTFEEFAKKATGINRIGILRADVDNLGQAFVAGFNNKENHNRYVTLSRTTTLSRQLSIFFKYFINDILKNAKFHIDADNHASERKTTIIYSGGDDVFVVGAWDDVIELGIDLKEAFEKYTQGTLSISAGIGVYEHAYPIAAIARETGDMESASKHLPGKNAVTLFEDGEKHIVSDEKGSCVISDGTYSWDELKNEVILEKYRTIEKVLGNTENRGMSFLYHMLELIRNQKEKINFARFVYLLSKLETDDEELEQKKQYRDFSKKMIQWVQNEKDCRQLKTAINMYAYMQRKEGDASNADNRN